MVDGPVAGELLWERLRVPTTMLVFGPWGIELRSSRISVWRVVVPMTPATMVKAAPKFLFRPALFMICASKIPAGDRPGRVGVVHACAETVFAAASPIRSSGGLSALPGALSIGEPWPQPGDAASPIPLAHARITA